MKVALIGCGKTKLPHRAKARDLYTGNLFRAALTYAEATADRVFVLSAAHGLLPLDREIDPYDFTIADLAPEERAAWGARVGGDLAAAVPDEDAELVALAGAPYLDLLDFPRDFYWTEPLRGLGVGERLAWFAANAPAPTRRAA